MASIRAVMNAWLDTMASSVSPRWAASYSSLICCIKRATSLLFLFSVSISSSPGQDSPGINFEADTRAFMAERVLACFAYELVGVRCVEIDLLVLRDQIALILGIEHRLRSTRRHRSIWTEDGHLVLQSRHVEGFIACVVIGGHFICDLRRRMRVHPLQCLDVGVHQLLDNVFVAVDVTVVHKQADEWVRPVQSRLRRLWRAQVDQDFSDTRRQDT